MDQKTKTEFQDICKELSRQITVIEAVAADLRRNFRGVGNETCAAVLEQVAADYKHLIQSLEEQMRL
jgi:hypothetical protein